MKNYIQRGDRIPVAAPSGGVTSGDGVLVGNLFGVATMTAAVGVNVDLQTTDVVELPKLGTDTITQGQLVYWDATNKRVTETASGNYPIGVATDAAGNGVTKVAVRLDGVATVAAS